MRKTISIGFEPRISVYLLSFILLLFFLYNWRLSFVILIIFILVSSEFTIQYNKTKQNKTEQKINRIKIVEIFAIPIIYNGF